VCQPALRRKVATDKLVEKIVKHDSWPIKPDILNPLPPLRVYFGPLKKGVVLPLAIVKKFTTHM